MRNAAGNLMKNLPHVSIDIPARTKRTLFPRALQPERANAANRSSPADYRASARAVADSLSIDFAILMTARIRSVRTHACGPGLCDVPTGQFSQFSSSLLIESIRSRSALLAWNNESRSIMPHRIFRRDRSLHKDSCFPLPPLLITTLPMSVARD